MNCGWPRTDGCPENTKVSTILQGQLGDVVCSIKVMVDNEAYLSHGLSTQEKIGEITHQPIFVVGQSENMGVSCNEKTYSSVNDQRLMYFCFF